MPRGYATLKMHPHTQKSRSETQNGIYWPDILTEDALRDICSFVTNQTNFRIQWEDEDSITEVGGRNYRYNVGNVIIVEFNGTRTFVTLGVPTNDGRNSYFQQIGPAFRRYTEDFSNSKQMAFYALSVNNNGDEFGRVYTSYHHFMYRVLNAAGISGNWLDFLEDEPADFIDIEDMVRSRNSISRANNNSSYAYYDDEEESFLLFLKTYGASKYESFFLALASIYLEIESPIEVHALEEGELNELPEWINLYLEQISDGRLICQTLGMEMDAHRAPIEIFPPKLRSPRHRVNVRLRCGDELCAMCGQNDSAEIEAAHVWDVHVIRRSAIEGEANEDLWFHATTGDNGFWLCKYHHRLFDQDNIAIDGNGQFMFKKTLSARLIRKIYESLSKFALEGEIMSDDFMTFLSLRNQRLDGEYGLFQLH